MPLYLLPFASGEITAEGARNYQQRYDEYRCYLQSERERVSAKVIDFALAPWHYDSEDPRSPKYAQLLDVRLGETEKLDDGTPRLEVLMRLRAYSGSRILILRYSDVHRYTFNNPNDTPVARRYGRTNHGQLLIDEFAIDGDDVVVHHLLWNNGAHWQIGFKDIDLVWDLTGK